MEEKFPKRGLMQGPGEGVLPMASILVLDVGSWSCKHGIAASGKLLPDEEISSTSARPAGLPGARGRKSSPMQAGTGAYGVCAGGTARIIVNR